MPPVRILLPVGVLGMLGCASLAPAPTRLPTPLVIAHRGASGHLPEHTLAAYALAIELGADCIEPDLVATRDGALIARHDLNLAGTTDVAQHPEFADRRRTAYLVDGVREDGWFASDFTLAEIRTLRARQALPEDRFTGLDGRLGIPTLDEILALARTKAAEARRTVCLYPELKHPSHHRTLGLGLEERVAEVLRRHGLAERGSPVFVQSFEPSSLERLGRLVAVRRILLVPGSGVDADGRVTHTPPYDRPPDWAQAGRPETWADLVTPAGLDRVARFADGIGVWKPYLVRLDAAGRAVSTGLVEAAHARGLAVHAWTFRNEARWLPRGVRSPTDELRAAFALGVDGVFADFPETAYAARAQHWLDAALGRDYIASE